MLPHANSLSLKKEHTGLKLYNQLHSPCGSQLSHERETPGVLETGNGVIIPCRVARKNQAVKMSIDTEAGLTSTRVQVQFLHFSHKRSNKKTVKWAEAVTSVQLAVQLNHFSSTKLKIPLKWDILSFHFLQSARVKVKDTHKQQSFYGFSGNTLYAHKYLSAKNSTDPEWWKASLAWLLLWSWF